MLDLVVKLFGKQQNDSWEKNKEKIINYVKTLDNEFILYRPIIDIKECVAKSKNPSFMSDLEVDVVDGVRLIFTSFEIWNELKEYIPKTITKMTLPSEIFNEDYEFLSTFPNLQEINIPNYKLGPEAFNFLNNHTSIRKINTEFIDVDKVDYINNSNSLIVDGITSQIYGDKITITSSQESDGSLLYIYCSNSNDKLIFDVLKHEDISKYDRIYVNGKNCNIYTINTEKNTLEINNPDINNTIEILNIINSKGIELSSVEINVENIDYTNYDYEKLKNIIDCSKIIFKYETVSKTKYDDFASLVEAIRWYRRLIADYDLSPVEKLMYAYDIMKTFEYRENEDDKSMSRYPDKILKSGDIVCVGYSNFLKEILKYVDPGLAIYCASVTCARPNDETEGHERNLVRIDDDKYGIHGLYVVDATWDSVITSEKTIKALGDSYTALDLYNYFLIPYEDYEKTFKGDTMPALYKYMNDVVTNNPDKMSISDWPVSSTLIDLFGTDKVDEAVVQEYLNVKRPSLSQFCEMLYRVRMAEGYSEEMIKEEILKVQQINNNSIGIMQRRGEEIEFFQDDSVTR